MRLGSRRLLDRFGAFATCEDVLFEQVRALPPPSAFTPHWSHRFSSSGQSGYAWRGWPGVYTATSQGSDVGEAASCCSSTAETIRLLEHAYRGSDFVKRRLATLEALAPRPGETIVDVGNGLGP